MSSALDTETVASEGGQGPCARPDARVILRTADRGPYDGAWWPRSRRLLDELPSLITALTASSVPVSQVLFSLVFWDATGRELTCAGGTVQLRGFRTVDPRLVRVTGRHGAGGLDVLVLPPETDPAVAARTMASAVGARRPSLLD